MRRLKAVKSRYSDAKLRKMTYDELTENMTDAQITFCTEYVARNEPMTAAAAAGYSVKNKGFRSVGRLFEIPEVADLIRWLKIQAADASIVSAQDIINQLTKMAFYDISDYVDVSDGNVSIKDFNAVDSQIISEVRQTKDGVSIKFADRLAALRQLSEYLPDTPYDKQYQLEREKLEIAKEKLAIERSRAGFGLEVVDDGFIKAIESAAEKLDLNTFENMDVVEVQEITEAEDE